jgi:hypothetical protein
MNYRSVVVSCVLALAPLSVHASTEITEQKEIVTEKLPKPAHIWVYDFAATPADVPADSALAGQYSEHSTPPTSEQIDAGRQVGAELASDLVDEIHKMGMPAERADAETKPEINDLVIRGYLVSVIEGDAKKRLAMGFGSGASELKVAAEGFQMTDHGLRKLGGGSAESKGSKAPGAALGVVGLIATHNPVGLIVSTGVKEHSEKTGSSKVEGRAADIAKEIAGVLEKRFQEQGWIEKGK